MPDSKCKIIQIRGLYYESIIILYYESINRMYSLFLMCHMLETDVYFGTLLSGNCSHRYHFFMATMLSHSCYYRNEVKPTEGEEGDKWTEDLLAEILNRVCLLCMWTLTLIYHFPVCVYLLSMTHSVAWQLVASYRDILAHDTSN